MVWQLDEMIKQLIWNTMVTICRVEGISFKVAIKCTYIYIASVCSVSFG